MIPDAEGNAVGDHATDNEFTDSWVIWQ